MRKSAAQPEERVTSLDAIRDAPLHIVLVEPQIPPNTGNVARLCAATGAALHLVEPLGFEISDRALKRAGLDYWDSLGVIVHASLEAFLACDVARRAWFLSTRATASYHTAAFSRGDALVFGSETAGLPAAVLEHYAERALRIPMRPHAVRSLNLSTSVGIVAYAALTKIGFPELL
jgi:tRNA (cytidine/uridine-2'-O-)-methyltransferase